jgi:hypothetical protein
MSACTTAVRLAALLALFAAALAMERQYNFTVAWTSLAPDGFLRPVRVYNGQVSDRVGCDRSRCPRILAAGARRRGE